MGNAASLTMNHCYLIDEGDKKRLVKTWLKKARKIALLQSNVTLLSRHKCVRSASRLSAPRARAEGQVHLPARHQGLPGLGLLFASPATLDGMSHVELAPTLVTQNGGAHETSWSTPPRPRGIRSAFPSVSPASSGKTSSSCISCGTHVRSPGPRSRRRSGAARVRC